MPETCGIALFGYQFPKKEFKDFAMETVYKTQPSCDHIENNNDNDDNYDYDTYSEYEYEFHEYESKKFNKFSHNDDSDNDDNQYCSECGTKIHFEKRKYIRIKPEIQKLLQEKEIKINFTHEFIYVSPKFVELERKYVYGKQPIDIEDCAEEMGSIINELFGELNGKYGFYLID